MNVRFGGVRWTNIGNEQDGKGPEHSRPVLIVKRFNKHLLWAVPLTSKHKEGKFYVALGQGGRSPA